MAGKKTQNTNQTQTTEPWSGAKPYYGDLYKAANTAFGATKPPPEKIYAPANATQRTALVGVQGQGQQMIDAQAGQHTGVDAIRGLAGDTVSGRYLDPNSNPHLRGAVEAAQHDTFRNFWEQTMPALKGGAQLNGTYGGDRTDLMMSRALEGAISDANRQANSIYYDNYNNERGRQMEAPGLFGGANALENSAIGTGTQGYQLQGATGDQMQNWDQAALDAELRKWGLNIDAMWDPINRFSGVLNAGGFNNQTGVTTTPRQGGSVFQGAVGGAGLGYQLGQQTGTDPRMAAIIASALGGASGH